jgi:crotonobetainyl-CoA:carnitine CoA-transferase CaiB-like acyl-CoA transferase
MMRPLEGIRVIDLTHALAGPVCTYQLALLGAEVIKIENPQGGDDFRTFSKPTFDAVNSGKKSVTLNFKDEGALAVLAALARDADVLVDNFKPGTAAKFGITAEAVRGWNERLIWCSISGFGLSGPWRDLPAVEWSVQAASGLSDSYLGDDDDPRDLGLPVLDISTGHAAATSILAALLQRAKIGIGPRVDVAMIDVALNLMAPRISIAGPTRMGRRPAVGRFQAKDGRLFVMGAHQRWFEAISAALGEPFLVADPRFATPGDREANQEELREQIEARLAHRSAEEWAEELTRRGIPAAPVRRLPEVVASDHVQQRGSLFQTHVSGTDQVSLVSGLPYQLSDGSYVAGPVPTLGEHTDEVLEKAGLAGHQRADLRTKGII